MPKPKDKVVNWAIVKQKFVGFWKRVRIFVYLIFLAISIVVINRFFLSSHKVDHDLIIRYLEVLRWPIVILVGSIVLRPYMPEIIRRARKIGPRGLELDPPQQEPVPNEDENSLPSAAQEADNFDLTTEAGRKKALTNFQLKWALEKAYRNIYGTQIEVLQRLAGFPKGLGEGELVDLYNKHKTLTPNPHPNITEFMRYLVAFGLIDFEPVQKVYTITDVGRLFLDYLQEENLNNFSKLF